MYQIIAEAAVDSAEDQAKKSPDQRYGAISVALDVLTKCKQADLDSIGLEDFKKRDHVYKWTDACIKRLKNIL